MNKVIKAIKSHGASNLAVSSIEEASVELECCNDLSWSVVSTNCDCNFETLKEALDFLLAHGESWFYSGLR